MIGATTHLFVILFWINDLTGSVTLHGKNYVLFPGIHSWNVVNEICSTSGLNMLKIGSDGEQVFLLSFVEAWKAQGHIHDDVWLGLHDSDPSDSVRYEWHADCSPIQASPPWAIWEPNEQATDFCIRMTSLGIYKTWNCKSPYHAICETNQECWFHLQENQRLGTTHESKTADLQTCIETCKTTDFTGGSECLALDFRESTGRCRIQTGVSLYTEASLPIMSSNSNSDVYVKVCYKGERKALPASLTTNSDSIPNSKCNPTTTSPTTSTSTTTTPTTKPSTTTSTSTSSITTTPSATTTSSTTTYISTTITSPSTSTTSSTSSTTTTPSTTTKSSTTTTSTSTTTTSRTKTSSPTTTSTSTTTTPSTTLTSSKSATSSSSSTTPSPTTTSKALTTTLSTTTTTFTTSKTTKSTNPTSSTKLTTTTTSTTTKAVDITLTTTSDPFTSCRYSGGRICTCGKSGLQVIDKQGPQLTLVKTTVSAYRRSKTSASDTRVSAVSIGVCGIVIIALSIAAISLPDLDRLLRFIFQKGNRAEEKNTLKNSMAF